MIKIWICGILCAIFVFAQNITTNQPTSSQFTQAVSSGQSALPVPRFVSIRSNANMHIGPGSEYAIDWQYVIPFFPLEVIAEFGHWRQVRDFQGTTGWIHKSVLTGKRHALVVNKTQNLMSKPNAQSTKVADMAPGVIGRIVQRQGNWCKIQVKWHDKTYKGWIELRHIWGLYDNETNF